MCLNTGVARVEIHKAEAQLSQLVERAQGGEEIILTRQGVPAVRLVVPEHAGGFASLAGVWGGQMRVAEDFDELPDEIAELLGDLRTP
jgi:prevent-host-death family protein